MVNKLTTSSTNKNNRLKEETALKTSSIRIKKSTRTYMWITRRLKASLRQNYDNKPETEVRTEAIDQA